MLSSKQSMSSPGSFVRYFLVAGVGFLLDFLVFVSILANSGFIYLANLGGFCVGAATNVLLIRRYVFPRPRFRLGFDIAMTWVSNGAMLALGMLILWLMADVAGFSPYWSKIISNGLTFVLNYITRITIFGVK